MTRENNEQSFTQHVNSSITTFIVGVLVLFIIKTVVLYSSAKNSNIGILRNVTTCAIVAIFFLFIFFTNISATEEKIICGKKNYKVALYATIIPFIFIYLIGIFSITMFPGWIRCFSNTFGSTFLNFCGLETAIVESSKVNDNINEIHKLYKQTPQILLNEIEVDVTGNISEASKRQLSFVGLNDTNTDKLLKQYIYSKESIGEGIWHFLLGMITILVSYNTILAENCNAFTVKKDDFRRYLNNKFQKN